MTACRALDRVIRAGRYWIPHWYKPSHWIAYWDVFGRPPTQPRYFRGIPETWWYDRDKAAKIAAGGLRYAARVDNVADERHVIRRLAMTERLLCVDRASHSAPGTIKLGTRGATSLWWRRCGTMSGYEHEHKNSMTAYILRRLLFMIPTMFGIMLVSFVVVQFAPGGPVERVIAQLTGTDTGATSRISGSAGGDFGTRGALQSGAQMRRQLQISRRPGPRSGIHQEPGEAVRLRQAGL